MMRSFENIIENFKNELDTEIRKLRTELTTYKSKNFYLDFEKGTDRLDTFSSERINAEFLSIPLAILDDERRRLHQALLQINMQLRNEFRQSYMELREINNSLDYIEQ